MKKLNFSEKIKNAVPQLKVLQIEAEITNNETSEELWREILKESENLKNQFQLDQLNKRPAIAATRAAYKALGKDPNRYRPSAEALGRRIINGKGLYKLSTLVDIINLISIQTGYSIGGFDMSKIEGDSLILDAGTAEDQFNAIGRGILNVDGLPLYRDQIGGIGTPTSDEERTKLNMGTTHLLMLVNIYAEETPAPEVEKNVIDLLKKYANLTKFDSKIVNCQ